MNNSKLAVDSVNLNLEEPVDLAPHLQKRESELIAIIENIRTVEASQEWSSLKQHIFQHLTDSLTKEIQNEAQKLNPDTHKLNRLTGELKWAMRFADLHTLAEQYRVELTQVRQRLHGTRKPD